ncbi:ExbD/TolR family protein [Pseudoprimorskyibacter insulae]|uniref:Biopolymer transport protein ExbD n=1 Tax=Pseudoprimorskyibacter insulae TaxID=1695997 RepID=A0A2R8ARA4_9RHOB|nr:biopolymer transporter ExbD [Pseudoprimorskyibacter insulae]SPF78369.1 Biopolymer transport protein ExbD [Pseudoprimorskyibacter insulae]
MSLLSLDTPRRSRRPSLTPMIDVVFLLLVFFMLAARFGTDMTLSLASGAGSSTYSGPPRLVTVAADGLRLNGVPVADELPQALAPLMQSPGDLVVLRPEGTATVQDMVDVLDILRRAGLTNLAVVD